MDFGTFLDNFFHPPVLFFFLGLIAPLIKSDLEIPEQIGKFLSLYLLFDIGLNGGFHLYESGFNSTVIKVIMCCLLGSFLVPFIVYPVLRKKLDIYNASAVSATYGSISAVTFATGTSFLQFKGIPFGGYIVAGMALMESPAIISGIINLRSRTSGTKKVKWGKVLHEAFCNGSVLLLVGALIVGYATGERGHNEVKPFVSDIFKGMLSLYMLDMGILAGRRLHELKKEGVFLVLFALIYPLFGASLGILLSYIVGLDVGTSLLLSILFASASYIAVPAAMRIAVPQANMSILLPMSLAVTFSFNVILGIPIYYGVIHYLWN